jgi:hypothetical protein
VALALVWLLSAFATAASLALGVFGLLPSERWSWLAAVAFFVFLVSSYVRLSSLEAELNLRPRLRADARDSPETVRIIPVAEPVGERGQMQVTHNGLFKMIRVEASAFVTGCVVRVVGLRQAGTDVPGFVPCGLRWFGSDGAGAEQRDFVGTHFALLLLRRPTARMWELQAPVRDGTGARFIYEPGDYEVQILVSAPNVQWPRTIRGVLHVGTAFDDVTFSPQ